MTETSDEIATNLTTPPAQSAVSAVSSFARDIDKDNHDDGGEDEETESPEEEPKLKYHRLTPNITTVYRGGDSASSFLVSGDKIVSFP
jgi:hypothetical protein